jgi:two-component system response regulator YesN
MSNDYSVQFAIGELVNDPLELPKSYQAARKALNREDSGTPSTTDRHTHRKAVRMAMSYVDERLHVNIGTSDIAAAVYMTPNHLMNVFKADTGMTIHEYLEQRRMHKAREMLSNPMYRTYEVAYACGYADPKYFSRVFKKRQGMSPTDYREKSASSL